MLKWFKSQSSNVKGMILLIIMLLIGIALRWNTISDQLSDVFADRFGNSQSTQIEADSTSSAR